MYLLAIDLGNSRTKLGFFHNGILLNYISINTIDLKGGKIRMPGFNHRIDFCMVASVVPEAESILKSKIKESFECTPVFLRYSTSLEIEVDYDDPSRLGADRLAHAFFVKNRIKENSVVVDIGTAVTVDFIGANGHFYGGVIFTGPQLQMDSLGSSTSLLNPSEWDKPLSPIGRSPEQAVESGILLAIVGGVKEIVTRGTETLKWYRYRKLLTGGGATFMLDPDYEFIEHLTLIGVYEAAKESLHTTQKSAQRK